MQHVTLCELYGTDTIRGFRGMVSVQGNENFVLVDEAGAYSGDDNRQLEIVRFDTPRPFYSPYHENAPIAIRVHGEVRPINYNELAENETLFGYCTPGPLGYTPVITRHSKRYELNCDYVTVNGVFYRFIGPSLPTPTCVVRVKPFAELNDRYDFQNRRIVGHVIHSDLGEELDIGELPADFDDYINSGCSDYNQYLAQQVNQ